MVIGAVFCFGGLVIHGPRSLDDSSSDTSGSAEQRTPCMLLPLIIVVL